MSLLNWMREKYTHIYDIYYWFNSLQIFMKINKHLKIMRCLHLWIIYIKWYLINTLNTWMTYLVQMFTSNDIIVWYHIQMEENFHVTYFHLINFNTLWHKINVYVNEETFRVYFLRIFTYACWYNLTVYFCIFPSMHK